MAGLCAGLLRPLQAELGNTGDVLSCSAALELVAELSSASSGAAAAGLAAILEPQLAALLHARDAFLQCQALRVRINPCFGSNLFLTSCDTCRGDSLATVCATRLAA
jgi:hypothetical protein